MFELKTESSPYVIIDNIHNIKQIGEFSGGLLTKLVGPTNTLIFSDNLSLSEDNNLSISGLHIWFENGAVCSKIKESIFTDIKEIDYCVKIRPELIKEFDSGRFSAQYPHIVRFLHTACLYLNNGSQKMDHLQFVMGEILNRPVGITHNNGIILGDRLVIDDQTRLIFYDCLLIGREASQQIKQTYEHFLTIPLMALSTLVLIGNENF